MKCFCYSICLFVIVIVWKSVLDLFWSYTVVAAEGFRRLRGHSRLVNIRQADDVRCRCGPSPVAAREPCAWNTYFSICKRARAGREWGANLSTSELRAKGYSFVFTCCLIGFQYRNFNNIAYEYGNNFYVSTNATRGQIVNENAKFRFRNFFW